MNSSTLRTVIAVVIFFHGIGHAQGLVPALGLSSTETWHPRSWLFTNLLGDTAARVIGLIIWFVGLIGFIATGLALLGVLVPHDWWRTLAIVFALTSMFGLIFYWNSLNMWFNKVGAIGVNVALLVGLLFVNWPSEADIGF